ncbi:trihelix transcription factor GTL2-like, partial [Olea europaea var. sylvestris]
MFDDMQPGDQFHQFMASSRTSLPIIPLSFPNPTLVPSFDPFSSHQLHLQLESSVNHKVEQEHEEQRERSMLGTTISTDPEWSHNEILALLRIRSNIENWFSDFTWEHVSRKLADLGFKRTAYKCKEKFEEESRNFNGISYNKDYRIFSEREDEFFPDDQHQEPRISTEKNQQNQEDQIGKENIVEGESERTVTAITASQENEEQVAYKPRENMKRKRRGDKFE